MRLGRRFCCNRSVGGNKTNVLRDFDDSRMYESIFGQQEPWTKSTAPGRFQKVGWDGYAMAYKIAADRLVDSLQRGPVSELYQVFPIMFLYRHYLELRLKEILRILRDWDGRWDANIPHIHDSPKLWEEVRQLLEKFDDRIVEHIDDARLEEGAAIFDAIEQRVKEFDEIDHGSFNFRYPEDQATKPDSVKLLERHEIVHIKEVVNAFDMNLDGISVGLDDILDHWNDRDH